MHEPLFSEAAIPERISVLRLRLRPYSVGHELFLHRIASPFLLPWTEFAKIPLADQISGLISASHICSQSFRQNLKPIRHLKLWQWRNRNSRWDEEIVKFRTYIVAGSREFKETDMPQESGTKMRYLGAPQLSRLYGFLCSEIPTSEIAMYGGSVWDFPFGLAKMLFQVRSEEAGGTAIYSYKDKIHDDYVAQEEAKEKAEQEKLKANA